MPPHHHVGVGAQPGHVVAAAHYNVLRRQLLDQDFGLGRDVPARDRAEPAVHPEHRPHRVPDGGVQFPDAGRVGLGLGHAVDPRPAALAVAGPIVRLNRCTVSTSLATASGGVAGSTPCPRLKMCAPPSPARRTWTAAASMTCSPASSTAGSRLPWITLPGMASRPRFSPYRQSTLTPSAA